MESAFKQKLAHGSYNNPDQSVINRMMVHNFGQMLEASRPDVNYGAACDLYEWIKEQPGQTTCSIIQEQCKILLNGPCTERHPYLIAAVDDGNRPLVVKMLPTHSTYHKNAKEGELRAITMLGLNKDPPPRYLVPCEVITVVGDIKDASTLGVGKGEKSALKMGWFAMSLDGGPQLTEELICAGVQCIVHALDYVHGMGLVHMDIKPGNFLLKYNGNWLLSDFGSSVLVNEPVWSVTHGMYPENLMGVPAEPRIDWGLLLVSVAMLLNKANISQLLLKSNSAYVDKAKVLERCATVQHAELRALLLEIQTRAGWTLSGS